MAEIEDRTNAPEAHQAREAAQRYEETTAEREARKGKVSGTPAELRQRARRLLEQGEVSLDTVLDLAADTGLAATPALERIIGEANDLQSSSFLTRGVRAATSVARITLRDGGRERPIGTGFLVSPRLLMTNQHVLEDPDAARRVVVEFCAEVDVDKQPMTTRRYELDPDGFFAADEHLDVALVLVRPGADDRLAGEPQLAGWNALIRQQGKIQPGEHLNLVGHPSGRLKEIAIRDNRLDNELPDFLHYSTDTEPGNSGSPVFNDQWEVVALHHSGVPRTNEQGRWLRKDGAVWTPADGDAAVDWVANEGARVSRILAFLSRLELTSDQRDVLAELGPTAELDTPGPRMRSAAHAAASTLPAQRTEAAGPRRGVRGRDGAPHLVFLHGRSQQGKDPERLCRAWTGGLNVGLTRAGMPGVEHGSAWFPFYGDRLVDAVAATESATGVGVGLGVGGTIVTSGNGAAGLAPPTSDPERVVYEELLAAAAAGTGMPADDLTGPEEGLAGVGASVVQRLAKQLNWVAARSGLDDAAIALLFRDVAAYLGRPGVREAVLDEVAAALPERGPVVLVSHSLGTVVAMDLVTRLERLDVPLLVTAGSPLGMDAVYRRLLSRERGRPAGVGRWVNAWCPADPVAIGCPLRRSWGTDVDEIVTDNTKDRAHDITEYLGSAAVSRVIGAVMSARV